MASSLMPGWRSADATRQARRRDMNELREETFLCECRDPGCVRTVGVTPTEYEAVRAHPTHFLIVANHESPDAESVVTETDRFAVVATLVGEASKIALRTDPRALYLAGKRS